MDNSIHIGERNDHGGRPEDNRDALGHASLMAGHLLVLASGTGGTGGGRMEGNLAVSTVLTQFRTLGDLGVAERLTSALSKANDILTDRGGQDPSLRGSGASCAAVLVQGGQLFACRSGDIRLYVVRGEQAVDVFPSDPKPSDQAIQEDSVRGASARIGALGAGFAARILVTAQPIPLAAGDRVVLASPGVHRYLDGRDMASLVGEHLPQVASGKLVDAARQAGSRQGISVQVIQFGEPETPVVFPAAPPAVAGMEATSPGLTMGEELMLPEEGTSAPLPLNSPVPMHGGSQLQTELKPIGSQEETGEFNPQAQIEAPVSELPKQGSPLRLGLPTRLRGRAANKFEAPTKANWKLPTAIAASLAALLWMWGGSEPALDAPVNGEMAQLNDEEGNAEDSETEKLGLEARIAPGEIQKSALDESDIGLVGNGGKETLFWSQVGAAVETGTLMNAVLVESWLMESEKDESAASEKAKAYLAELSSLRNALAVVALSDQVELTKVEQNRLSRIFGENSESGAKRLNEYLKNRYDLVGDDVFEGLELYVRQQRTPEVVRVLYALGQVKPRPGPRTRTWLTERLPLILSDH